MTDDYYIDCTFNVFLPEDSGRQLDRIEEIIKAIMTNEEAVQSFTKIESTLGKVSEEVTKISKDLRDALANSGKVSPEVEAGLSRLDTLATAIDEIVPDNVDPNGPPPVVTEPPAPQFARKPPIGSV